MKPRQQKAPVTAEANRKSAFEDKQQKNTIIRFPIQRRWPGPRQRIVAEYLAARRPRGNYRIPLPEDLVCYAKS